MKREIWFCFAFLAATLVNTAVSQQFQPAVYYNARPGTPRQVVTADFNNDGNLDFAVTLEYEGKVAVFLGRGDGTFLPAHKFRASGDAIGMAVGDLNADGKPDLVVTRIAGRGGRLSVYLGNGDGTFAYKRGYYPSGEIPLGVVLADFNGDGKLDVAIANRGPRLGAKGCVFVRFGRGDGTFGPAVRYEMPGAPWTVAAGDLNGDGYVDLVVDEDNAFGEKDKDTLRVLLNNGDGSFRQGVKLRMGPEPLDVAIADLNHDGKPDLVVAEAFGQAVAVLLGNGDGTFKGPTYYSTTSLGQAPTGVVVDDFNLDGIPDIAVGLYNGDPLAESGLLYGNGDGTFQSAVPVLESLDGGYSLAAGDFNNDGAPDLAIPIYDKGKVAVLLNAQ